MLRNNATLITVKLFLRYVMSAPDGLNFFANARLSNELYDKIMERSVTDGDGYIGEGKFSKFHYKDIGGNFYSKGENLREIYYDHENDVLYLTRELGTNRGPLVEECIIYDCGKWIESENHGLWVDDWSNARSKVTFMESLGDGKSGATVVFPGNVGYGSTATYIKPDLSGGTPREKQRAEAAERIQEKKAAELAKKEAEERAKQEEITKKKEAEELEKQKEIAKKEAEELEKQKEIAKKEVEELEKQKEIAKKEAELAKKEAELTKKEAEIAKKEAELTKKDVEIPNKEADVENDKFSSEKIVVKDLFRDNNTTGLDKGSIDTVNDEIVLDGNNASSNNNFIVDLQSGTGSESLRPSFDDNQIGCVEGCGNDDSIIF